MYVTDFAQRLKNVADEAKTFWKFYFKLPVNYVFLANETNVDARNSALPRHLLSSLAKNTEQELASVMHVADFAQRLKNVANEA